MDEAREQLIEILRKPIFPHELADPTEAVADYLLDSGVTVQRWIPVTERLPELKKIEDPDGDDWRESEFVLVSTSSKEVREGYFWKVNDVYGWLSRDDITLEVTSWMPLPQAPGKEGA